MGGGIPVTTNFYGVSEDRIEALTPGQRIILDAGLELTIREIRPAARQLVGTTDNGDQLRVSYDTVETLD